MLTDKEKEIYQYIRSYLFENGNAPSVSEIGLAVNQSSRGTTYRYLKQLAAKGFIELVRGKRNIRLLEGAPSLELPILGEIAAGLPIENFDTPEVLNLQHLVGNASCFLLKVKGDSMLGDNICDGDYIICDQVSYDSFRPNDILVIELVGGEVTLKRLKTKDSDRVELLSSNPAFLPQVYNKKDVRVRGIYKGLLRI